MNLSLRLRTGYLTLAMALPIVLGRVAETAWASAPGFKWGAIAILGVSFGMFFTVWYQSLGTKPQRRTVPTQPTAELVLERVPVTR